MKQPDKPALKSNKRRISNLRRTPTSVQQDVDLVRAYIANGGKVTKLPAGPVNDFWSQREDTVIKPSPALIPAI